MTTVTRPDVERKEDATLDECRKFLSYLRDWEAGWRIESLDDLIQQWGGPEGVAVVCIDMLEGFCRVGPLASPRVARRIGPIVGLLERAHSLGVRRFAICEDSHTPDALEFKAYPPHCIAGTEEARTVREIRDLPFFHWFERFPKNSINPAVGTGLESWLLRAPTRAVILVGDCTDICIYQAATHLRCLANQTGREWEIVVPADAVDTYDVPVEMAQEQNLPAHPAGLLHRVFLYHTAMNGVRVVRGLR